MFAAKKIVYISYFKAGNKIIEIQLEHRIRYTVYYCCSVAKFM